MSIMIITTLLPIYDTLLRIVRLLTINGSFSCLKNHFLILFTVTIEIVNEVVNKYRRLRIIVSMYSVHCTVYIVYMRTLM